MTELSDVTRVAAIDCGTNSIRLLVADVVRDQGGARLTDLTRQMRIVRLGRGVDRRRGLAGAAFSCLGASAGAASSTEPTMALGR